MSGEVIRTMVVIELKEDEEVFIKLSTGNEIRLRNGVINVDGFASAVINKVETTLWCNGWPGQIELYAVECPSSFQTIKS